MKSNMWILAAAFALYFAGAFFCPKSDIEKLKRAGMASQEEYEYETSDGDTCDGKSLIRINGVGKVISYTDMYLAQILLLIPSIVIGRFVFDDKGKFELEEAVFCGYIVGILLLWLTTKDSWIATAFYWAGSIVATTALRRMRYEE